MCRFALLLAAQIAVFACQCAWGPYCSYLGDKTGPVFLGTVLSVTDLPLTDEDKFLSGRKIRIQVDESFGGVPAEARELEVLTGYGHGDCGIEFEPGDRYLVKATTKDDGQLHTGECHGTRTAESAAPEIRVLRRQQAGQQMPVIVGQIRRSQRGFRNPYDWQPGAVLAGTRVRLESAGAPPHQKSSDADGIFEFFDVPVGQYKLTFDTPFGTEPDGLNSLEVSGSVCQLHHLEVLDSASIQGRLLDPAGKIVRNVRVHILPANAQTPLPDDNTYSETPDKSGVFNFTKIPPGRYILLVNPKDEQDPDLPYSRTYYPGVAEMESARVITVHPGEKITNADIHLKETFTPRQLTVHVTWADGTPVTQHEYIQAQAYTNPKALANVHREEKASGIWQLSLIPGEPYQIEAVRECSDAALEGTHAEVLIKSPSVHIAPNDNQTEIHLTLPGTACPTPATK